jgi:hypothetical protein
MKLRKKKVKLIELKKIQRPRTKTQKVLKCRGLYEVWPDWIGKTLIKTQNDVISH